MRTAIVRCAPAHLRSAGSFVNLFGNGCWQDFSLFPRRGAVAGRDLGTAWCTACHLSARLLRQLGVRDRAVPETRT